ncbi:jg1918 [Pararge aegeria aegeria]|uniref:Jg1918 protein n=1 Tax=Pararge aegeria aegeria TaxID=348720 RepID=A0A8S4R3A3_9NEOP|nr:jg1918 [Pararge aegeria aegeria]
MRLLSRFSYLRLLACSALVAAAPTIDEVAWMCDAARVSKQVASHTSDLPKTLFSQGENLLVRHNFLRKTSRGQANLSRKQKKKKKEYLQGPGEPEPQAGEEVGIPRVTD